MAVWLFILPDVEYQPMSINVETIGDALMIQRYVAEVRQQGVSLYA